MIKVLDSTFWDHVKDFVDNGMCVDCPSCKGKNSIILGTLKDEGVMLDCKFCQTKFILNQEVDPRIKEILENNDN
jgi:hypothetical protein